MVNQTSGDYWQHLLEKPRRSWWARLPFGVRMSAGATAVLVAAGGTVAGVLTWTHDEPRVVTAVSGQAAAPPEPPAPAPVVVVPVPPGPRATAAARRPVAPPTDPAPPPARRAPRATTPAAPPPAAPPPRRDPAPAVTTLTVSQTEPVPYRTRVVRDPALPRGARELRRAGAAGERVVRYAVTYVDGREVSRRPVGALVTREPRTRVLAVGTRRRAHTRPDGCDLASCLPLGRSAGCVRDESGTVTVDGSVAVLDEAALPALGCDDDPPAGDADPPR